jgi:hypothetical protein
LGCIDYPSFKCVQLKEKDCNGTAENFPCLGISTPDSLYNLLEKLEVWKCNYNILEERIKLSTDPCNPLIYGSDGGLMFSIPILLQCMEDQGCVPCGGASTCSCSSPTGFSVVFDGRGLLNPNTYRVKASWLDAICTPTVTYDYEYKLSSNSVWIPYAINQIGLTNTSLIVVGGQTYDFRLRAKGNDGQCASNYIYLNNYVVTQCNPVTNAVFNPVNSNLSWSSTPGKVTNDFLIETRKDDDVNWSLITAPVVESPSGTYTIDLSGYTFVANFIYHFRISNICSGVISSSGSGCAFDCVIPNQTAPAVSNITATSAQISWAFATGASGYTLTVNGGIPFNVGNVTTYVLSGLLVNTLVTVRVSPQCVGVSGACSGKTVTFNTLDISSCPNPENLVII